MKTLRGLLGRSGVEGVPSMPSAAVEYVICPRCGAGYNTRMVMDSLLLTDAWLADVDSWTTRVTCKVCGNQISVSGSRKNVFGRPKPA